MKTKTIHYLTILLTISIISSQSLLDNLKNVTIPTVSNVLPSGVNVSNLLPSGFNVSSIVPSGVNVSNIIPVVENMFKNGTIKEYLPKGLDLSKLDQVNKFLEGLNGENFNFNSQQLIPDLKDLTDKSRCVKRINKIFLFMSMAEQVAFVSAYQNVTAANANSTNAENKDRCFIPKVLHQAFKTVNQGNMKSMSQKLTQDSQFIKQSFSCVANSFKQLKLKADYKPEVEGFFNTQATANQCKGSFIRNMTQILGQRRRYLLLKEKELNETAVLDANGDIAGFNWIQSEVDTITKLFLTFAECYQGLPEALTTTYSAILNKVSEDEACVGTRRFLQATNSTSNASAVNPNNGTSASGSVVRPNNGTTPSGSPVNPNNGTSPSGSAPKPSGKEPKQAVGKVTFTDANKAELNAISDDLNKKDGDYLKVGQMVKGLISETSLLSKCNMANSVNGMLSEKNEVLDKLVKSEVSRLNKKEACKGDYLVYLTKPRGVLQGNLYCSSTDALCQNTAFTVKSNFNNVSFNMVSACVNSRKFVLTYSEDAKFGKHIDFISSTMQTCQKGTSNKCAKEFSNMNASQQGGCVPTMKKNCNDVITLNCQNSNLFKNMASLTPSASENPLPKECQNIDPVNPNYVPCFEWINKNLIAFTLFPQLQKIENLQLLLNENQAALRLLQTSTIKISQSDASSADTTAQLPKTETEISDSVVQIDGSTPSEVSITATTVDQIDNTKTTPSNTNNGNYNKFGYLLISLLIAFLI